MSTRIGRRLPALFVDESRDGERAQQRVGESALDDQADVADMPGNRLVQSMFDDVAPGGRQPLLDLGALVREGEGRMRHMVGVVRRRRRKRSQRRQFRRPVVLAHEAALQVAGADAQLQHGRHVRGLGQRERMLDDVDDPR